MNSFIATAVVVYLGIGVVVGVYSAIRHFRDDADDLNMLAMFAVVLGIGWPAVLYFLIKRRFFSKKISENFEPKAQRQKTLV